jgi:Glycosyltransferase family 9 (heptosyltransferase)
LAARGAGAGRRAAALVLDWGRGLTAFELTGLLAEYRRDPTPSAGYALLMALRGDGRIDEAAGLLGEMAARDLSPGWTGTFGIAAYLVGEYDMSVALLERTIRQATSDYDKTICMLDVAASKFATGRYHEGHPIIRVLGHAHWLGVQAAYVHGEDYWWRPFSDRLLYDQDVAGRRIMMTHDQGGYGDLFQAVRYVDELRRQGAARVYLVAPSSVTDLLQTKTAVEVYPGRLADTDWDFFCPTSSLFGRYQTSPFSPYWAAPYLFAPPGGEALVGPGSRPKIGLVWRSATRVRHEPFRSMPLPTLLPLLEQDGVDWISLQVDVNAEEQELLRRLNVTCVGDRLDSFARTASTLKALDLLISIDSAPVHLAGALGRPVWALLAKVADYRWYDDLRFTPWYASVRLFRQSRLGDWSNVIADVGTDLRTLSASSAGAS